MYQGLCVKWVVEFRGSRIIVDPLTCQSQHNERFFLSVEDRPPKNRIHGYAFCLFDLDVDLDPVILIYEFDLNIMKMY